MIYYYDLEKRNSKSEWGNFPTGPILDPPLEPAKPSNHFFTSSAAFLGFKFHL